MITFETKNYEVDLGYMGFFCLRGTIAGIFSPELEELYKEYCVRGIPTYSSEEYALENKQIKEQYENKVNDICKNPDCEKVFDFLHMSDSEGEIDSDICKAIWEVIKNYDNDVCYGYYDYNKPFTFSTFKGIIKDGIDSKKGVKWR